MKKWQICILALLAVSTLLCVSCATTTFESTWKNPDAQPLQLSGQKVAAVFVSRDPILRRRTEDAMASEITARGADGVPAYTFLSDRDIRDRDLAKAKFEALGCAGAVVMRIVGSETRYTETPGVIVWVGQNYHHLWGGYWGWGWGTVWQPGYLAVDRVLKVETLVYSVAQDQLVWAGVSRTFRPRRVERSVAELAVAISKQMAREGLITRD